MLNKETGKDILNTLEQIKSAISSVEERIREEINLNEEEINFNSIFQGKTAIIGNYDYTSSNELKKILQLFGMKVEIVKTGLEILDKIKNNCNYDIIFTNHIYQSGIMGEELLKKLKQIDGFNTPVIIHTIDKNKRNYYMNVVGFDEYITKPIFFSDKDKIIEIKSILEKFI